VSELKYHLTTYGCQMNKNDSERIAGLLASLGFDEASQESEADLIVVNTCSVRQSADERVYGSQEKYFEYKKRNPRLVVAVTGCLPGRDAKGRERPKMAATDLYFPIADLVKLPGWLKELRPEWWDHNAPQPPLILRGGVRGDEIPPLSIRGGKGELSGDYLSIPPLRLPSSSAFVTIQTGCNKYCAYCVVPYARGLERCRSVRDILDECRQLVAHGVLEITLLGQSVNSFRATDPETFSTDNPFRTPHPTSSPSPCKGEGRGEVDFAALLWEVNQLESLQRLHWTAAHPMSMTDEVIAALALPKQVNYLHLPVQSGSDEVLRRMNRKYTREQYLEIIRKVKEARPATAGRPGIALGTDIIVGFSGETREQFEETLSLYREVGFDVSYHAQYSTRPGTLAAKIYPDDVPTEEKKRRWEEIQTLMEKMTLQKNQAYQGQIVSILVDKVENGVASGNSSEMKLVQFPSDDQSLVGKIVSVMITKPKTWVLVGKLVMSPPYEGGASRRREGVQPNPTEPPLAPPS